MSTLHSSSQATSSTNSSRLPIQIIDVESDESDLSESDIELPDIPLADDQEYQESVNTTTSHNPISQPTASSSLPQYSITLPAPPARPSHFRCDPAWHYDKARSPVNSDCEELEFSEDSEEGVLYESQPSDTEKKKNKKKKKRKSRASRQNRDVRHQEHKKTRTDTAVTEAYKHEVYEGANIHALIRRAKGRQPSSQYERPIQEIYTGYRTFSRDEVQNGLIIKNSRQRTLVHLFPPETIPSHLIQTLASSLHEYDNSVSFPNYDYTYKRGDYQVHILGCWFKSGRFLQPYMTAHYRGPHSGIHYKRLDNPYYMAAKRFKKANCGLFQLVEDLIRQHYPDIWKVYSQIQVPPGCNKFAGLFAAVVINKLVQTKIHKDLGDIKGGICIVICWGNFKGGELVFTELTSCVPFPAGSIIMFRSSIISHYNLAVFGDWYSMVFTTDKNLSKWSNAQQV